MEWTGLGLGLASERGGWGGGRGSWWWWAGWLWVVGGYGGVQGGVCLHHNRVQYLDGGGLEWQRYACVRGLP